MTGFLTFAPDSSTPIDTTFDYEITVTAESVDSFSRVFTSIPFSVLVNDCEPIRFCAGDSSMGCNDDLLDEETSIDFNTDIEDSVTQEFQFYLDFEKPDCPDNFEKAYIVEPEISWIEFNFDASPPSFSILGTSDFV